MSDTGIYNKTVIVLSLDFSILSIYTVIANNVMFYTRDNLNDMIISMQNS